MKKLFVFLLFVVAAWYGWKHYPEFIEFLNHRPGHEVVIENASGLTMVRIRIMVDGQTLVRESLDNGAKAVIPFKVQNNASFKLEWGWREKLGDRTWSGGMVPKGPMVQRHIMQVDAEGGVTYTAENR
jgi:hypothetical protein